MHRSWPLIAALLGASLLLAHAPEVEAKKAMVRAKPSPKPKPTPQPEVWGTGAPAPVVPNTVDGSGDLPENGPKPPVVEATATVWAQAGSRSWTGCAKVASEAGKQLFGFGEEVNNFGERHHWGIQAGECPNAPEVLLLAARSELLRRFDLPEALDGTTDLSAIEEQIAVSRTQAVAWLDAAETELRRRRDSRGVGSDYWRARALLSSGDLAAAEQALRRGLREGSIEGWKLRRMLAVVELFAGDLEGALEQANRASIDAPYNDRLVSGYVLALVLDRAGDSAGAARRMKFTLDTDADQAQLRALEMALPMHERLYLRAFASTVRDDASSALRLWDAYLARPQPEAPERRLAERHRSLLEPRPSNLGGLPKPDEGRAAEAGGAQP